MQKKHVEVSLLAAATLASIVCAIWNAVDELSLLQNWYRVASTACMWLFIPWIVAVRGAFTPNPSTRRVNLALSVCFAALFALYASNGPTADRGEGAQHMHLIVVPALTLFATLAVWGSVLLLRGLNRLCATK